MIEIGDATLRYDLEVKVALYARCGIPEVWVINLAGVKTGIFRGPANGEYTERRSRAKSSQE